MNLIFNGSQALKLPLYEATRGALGEWMMDGLKLKRIETLEERILAVATVAFYLIGMLFAVPLWALGEVLEVCTEKGRALFKDEVDLDDAITLTQGTNVGTSVSVFQATSNPEFCSGTAIHKALKGGAKSSDRGVDILTTEGRKMTADRLKQMGANAFRFSVEQADVQVNGLDAYIETAKFFHEKGFKLTITLDWWLGDGTIDFLEKPGDKEKFVAYAEACYNALHPYASTFLTFNEPTVDANQKYLLGDLPPNKVGRFWRAMRLTALKLDAHRAVYNKFHELEKGYEGKLQVGLSHQAVCMVASSRFNLIARIVSFVMTHAFHESFMRLAVQPEMMRTLDFIAIQYYARPMAGMNGFKIVDSIAPPGSQMVEGMRYRFDPKGILPVLRDVYARLNKPIMVTETGTAGEISPHVPSKNIANEYFDANSKKCFPPTPEEGAHSREMERRKATYYRESLCAIAKAQSLGVPVTHVLLWTLFDNLEWRHRYKSACAFGILARDRETGLVRITEGFEAIREIFWQTQTVKAAQ